MAKISICIDTDSDVISIVTQSNGDITIKVGKIEKPTVEDFIKECSAVIARTDSTNVSGGTLSVSKLQNI
jgi:hypothetical protein